MKDNRAQMMDVKIIYLQRIQSYQVAKSSLRQEANTFDILKLHCRRFYTSLRGKYYPRYCIKNGLNRGILRNIQFPSGIKTKFSCSS